MNKEKSRLRILVIEDNYGDFILLKKSLERAAIPIESIHLAKQLTEVEAVLKEHRVDLAFLDLSLPDSSGVQSFIELNKQLPHVPILVLSGSSDMEIALETIALGSQDYLVKGEFDEKLLVKSVQYAMERKKVLEALKETNERYEIVNKATQDIIWDWNLATNELYLGSSVTDILGDIGPMVTMDWFFENLHPDDVTRVRRSLEEALQNKISNWSAEYRFMAPDQTYKCISAKAYTVFDSEGQPSRMIGAATDLTEKIKLENQLAEQKLNHQKLITETTIRAQEKERNELAKELHDNINQVLATVKMFLNIARDDDAMREDLVKRSYNNINYAIEEIRKLSKSLVAPSLGDIGIEEALQELVDEINITGGLNVELHYQNQRETKLNPTINLMLYRIVQEQMNNVVKYAKATSATITLKLFPDVVLLSVADNGVGFNPVEKSKGIGLQNITSRVEFYSGQLKIITAPGKGCTLDIHLPV